MKGLAKRAVRRLLPLRLRTPLASALARARVLPRARRERWAAELIRDLAQHDRGAYHRFLWSHHLDYAGPYETEPRFARMRESRRILFDDLTERLDGLPRIESVLEVGCSCGYQLRHLETVLGARELLGIDIDARAVDAGNEHLARLGSRVRLKTADVHDLPDRRFDLVLCTGVLLYLPEAEAARVVATLLRHTNVLLALSGPADAESDNRGLAASSERARDRTLIHNLDRMVEDAGGRVIGRRWDGARLVDGQSVYFVFAASAPVGTMRR